MTTLSDYLIEHEIYFGPLDLLLYLVRRSEVDVCKLQLGEITRKFQQYQEVLEFLDLDLTGDFVVALSSLVEIKSRQVLPSEEESAEETEAVVQNDSSSEIIQQLLHYKRYKEVGLQLEDQAAAWQERYPRLSSERPTEERNPATDRIKDVELWDLVSALGRVLETKEIMPVQKMQLDETPISVYSERIREKISTEGEARFSQFFDSTNERSRIVGIFLAILELLRHHGYRAKQPDEYGEIFILPPGNSDA